MLTSSQTPLFRGLGGFMPDVFSVYVKHSSRGQSLLSAELAKSPEGLKIQLSEIEEWLKGLGSLNSHWVAFLPYQKEGLKFLAEELREKKKIIAERLEDKGA